MASYTYQTSFYVIGGTLERDAPSYVERQADEDLYRRLIQSKFCYVLTPRQMGKSSLMVRTATRLRKEGVAVAVLDLTAIGQNLTAEQWYDGLLGLIGQQLDLEDELDEFWLEHGRLGPMQRWMRAIKEIVLPRCSSRLIIFVDEIDAVRSLPFSTDEFFAGIREFYNHRTEDPTLERLTFCLMGVATPSDLIRDTRTTPFNIGQRIELNDFTDKEAAPLARGLRRKDKLGEAFLQRVFYWTGGHPYLTQRLCQAVAEDSSVVDSMGVDRVCEQLFLTTRARERDDNLLFVRERLLRTEADLASLLDLYAKVRGRKRVRDDDSSSLVSILRLSGITRVVDGLLSVRNRIYHRVFDREWIIANMPDAELRRQRAAYRRGLLRATAVGAVIVAMITSLAVYAFAQRNHAKAEAHRADQNAHEFQKAYALAQEQKSQLEREGGRLVELVEQQRIAEQRRVEAEQQRQQALRGQEIAEQHRVEAEQQHQQALRGQETAEQQRVEAEQQRSSAEHETRRFLYSAKFYQAEQVWETGNVVQARALLADQLKPGQNELRGFEWYYLWRLSHPELLSLRHERNVLSAAISPDGMTLATASGDGTAKLWDAATGKERATLKKDSTDVFSLSFSPDGRRLATGGGEGAAIIWDAITGDRLLRINAHKGTVSSVAFSSDGKMLATGSDDATARLWDVATGRELAAPMRHELVVLSVAFSPDGKNLVTGSRDHTAKLWDVVTGLPVVVFKGHTGPVLSVAISPDGRKLATGGGEGDRTLKLWDMTTGKELASLPGRQVPIYSVAFSPDGKILATGLGDHTASLWDVATKQELKAIKGHTDDVLSVAFSRDGKRLITGSRDHTAKLWNIPTDHESSAILRHAEELSCTAFSPDGTRLATESKDGTITLWDVASGQLVISFKGHTGGTFSSVAFSADGKRLATVGADKIARIWDVKTGHELVTLSGHTAPIPGVAFSPDGRTLATGSFDGTAKLWDGVTGQELANLKNEFAVWAVAFSPDGKRLATGSGGKTARLWDVTTGQELIVFKEHGATISSVAFSPDGKTVATGSFDRTAKLWDSATGQELATFKGHKDEIWSVAFSPDGKRLLTGSVDDTAKLWDVATGQELVTFKGHDFAVRSVAFSPDGKTLASASKDKTVRLWRGATEQEVRAQSSW